MAKKTRKRPARITGVIRLGEKVYRAGDEGELAKAVTADQVERYRRLGAIAGEWAPATKSNEAPAPAEATATRKRA